MKAQIHIVLMTVIALTALIGGLGFVFNIQLEPIKNKQTNLKQDIIRLKQDIIRIEHKLDQVLLNLKD